LGKGDKGGGLEVNTAKKKKELGGKSGHNETKTST